MVDQVGQSIHITVIKMIRYLIIKDTLNITGQNIST